MSEANVQLDVRQADERYFEALDAERAKVLRKRIRWYAIVAVVLMIMGALGNILDILGHESPDHETSSAVLCLSDLALIALYGGGIGYLARRRPDRRGLVSMLTVLTIAAMAIAMPFEVIADWARTDTWANGETGDMSRINTMFRSVNAFGMFFCLACVLVPMKPKESGRIAAGCAVIFAAVIGLMLRLPVRPTMTLSGLFLVYSAVGIGWSWWRYRAFDFYFKAENLRDRYNDLSGEVKEISAELTQARKFHEALFPAEITTGPLQMSYQYEPMREIGGDFLYVNSEPGGAATVVLIDVSGHGIPAALAVNRLHGELQRFFSHYPTPTGESGLPGHLLMNLNTYACAALSPQAVFATALVLRAQPGNGGTLEWASAGHPPAFLRRTSGESEELGSTAIMLGVVGADTFDAAPRQTKLDIGDLVLAYTDGAMEARDGEGRDFTMGRILEVMQAGKPEGASGTVASAVRDAVVRHRRGKPSDDTLIVEVRCAGVAAAKDELASSSA
jgi:serine phosphatase RsbU (regulator of sigma subunit)